MKLSDLLVFNEIVIQCHDNPDADAIASGFALYSFFKAKGKTVRQIYSGNFKISKRNLKFMVEELRIPIEYVPQLETVPELLITCDCQYGEGNVRKFEAKNIAVIDHHQIIGHLPELSEVRPGVGSCSTIIWDMLGVEEYEPDYNLSTALYYGLFMDTNTLNEIAHPLDRDMAEQLTYDKGMIKRMNNMNLTVQEAKIAGIAMLGVEVHDKHRYAIMEAQPCDPNILGLISDFFLSVDSVDVCLVFSVLDFGVKFSIRSCTNEVRADELAEVIACGIGSGGGHMDKAGGSIARELLAAAEPDYALADNERRRLVVLSILRQRMHDYFANTDIIYAGKDKIDLEGMKKYVNLPRKQGYAIPADFIEPGTQALVRSLEGDMNFEVTTESVIMIGVRGEIYVSRMDVLSKNYDVTEEPYTQHFEYYPTVKNMLTGETISLRPYAKTCSSKGGNKILAKKIDRTTKVFTKWNQTEYLKGEAGDYLAVKINDPDDVYIINRDILGETYLALGEVDD